MSHSSKPFCLLLLLLCLSVGSTHAQWSPLNLTPTDRYQEISFPSELVGYMATKNDLFDAAPLFKTTDGGATWDTIPYPIPAGYTTELELVQFLDAQNGYLIGTTSDTSMVFPISESFMLKTTDGGSNWTDISPNPALSSPLISFVDANLGLVSGTEEVHRTTDGGMTWDSINIPDFGPFFLQMVSPTIGYIGGFELVGGTVQTGWMSKTTDGGITWTPLSYPGNYTLFRSAYFVDEDNGYAVGENPSTDLLRTTNGGQSWSIQPLTQMFGEELWFLNDSTGYLTEGNEIWKTVDFGTSWALDLSDPQNRNISDIKFTGNIGIACGANGLLYKNDLATGIDVAPMEHGLRIVPNPVSARGSLIIELPNGISGTIQLMDLSGKVLLNRAIDSDDQEITVELNRQNLAPGTYLAAISLSNGHFGTQKVVIAP